MERPCPSKGAPASSASFSAWLSLVELTRETKDLRADSPGQLQVSGLACFRPTPGKAPARCCLLQISAAGYIAAGFLSKGWPVGGGMSEAAGGAVGGRMSKGGPGPAQHPTLLHPYDLVSPSTARKKKGGRPGGGEPQSKGPPTA